LRLRRLIEQLLGEVEAIERRARVQPRHLHVAADLVFQTEILCTSAASALRPEWPTPLVS